MSGKGSRPRPRQVSEAEYARNWDRIFRRKQVSKNTTPSKKLTTVQKVARGRA